MKQLILLGFIVTLSVSAAVQSYKVGKGKITFNMPYGWETNNGFLGSDFMMVGPMVEGKPPTISFSNFNQKIVPFKIKDPKQELKKYQIGRMAWLSKVGGTLEEFYPIKQEEWSKDVVAHRYGWSYNLGNFTMVEHSYYLSCNGNFYNMKVVITDKHRRFMRTIDNIKKSLKCE